MPRITPALAGALEGRARGINALVERETHPSVELNLQRTYGALNAAANVLAMLFRIGETAARGVHVASNPAVLDEAETFRRRLLVAASMPRIVHSGEMLAAGRDAELYRELGKRSLFLAIDIGAKLSGIGYIKDAADIFGTVREVADTGEALKLRRDQVRVASQLLKWSDAIFLLTLAWCYSAELTLVRLAWTREPSESDVVDRIVRRAARNARSWSRPA